MRPSEAARHDDVVHRALLAVRVLELERRQLDDLVLAGEDAREARLEVAPAHRAEEADAPEVHAHDRDAGPEEARQRAEDGPVAAEHDRDVGRGRVAARLDALLLRLVRAGRAARRRAPARPPGAARRPRRSARASPCVTTATRATRLGERRRRRRSSGRCHREAAVRSVDEDARRTPGSPSVRALRSLRRRPSPHPTRALRRSRVAIAFAPHLGVADDALRRRARARPRTAASRARAPPSPASRARAPAAAPSSTLMNETSQVTSSGANGSSGASRAFVRSSTVTRGSSRSFGCSCP